MEKGKAVMGLIAVKHNNRMQILGDMDGFLAYAGEKLNRSTYYVVCLYGIGDTFYVAALMESYRRQYPRIRRICMIVKKGHAQIPDWFDALCQFHNVDGERLLGMDG